MNKILNKKFILFSLITLLFFCLDFFSKFAINIFLKVYEKIIIIPDFLSFEKVYNSGAAFSMMKDSATILIIISILALSLIIGYVFQKSKELNNFEFFSLALVSGGAIGNLIDRIQYSYVIDFIQLEFVNFPIFNLADVFINIGVIILIVSLFIFRRNGK